MKMTQMVTVMAIAIALVLAAGCVERLPVPEAPQPEQLPANTPFPTYTAYPTFTPYATAISAPLGDVSGATSTPPAAATSASTPMVAPTITPTATPAFRRRLWLPMVPNSADAVP